VSTKNIFPIGFIYSASHLSLQLLQVLSFILSIIFHQRVCWQVFKKRRRKEKREKEKEGRARKNKCSKKSSLIKAQEFLSKF
jgi:hypothetical protein